MGVVMLNSKIHGLTMALAFVGTVIATPAFAQSLFPFFGNSAPQQDRRMAYAPSGQSGDEVTEQSGRFKRQVVDYRTSEAAGTIIVDTPHTYLYYVLGNGKAVRYGIGVGREGFTWSGTQTISRKAEWPDWIPPKEMVARQPYLPRWVSGGPGNPLGARAMYLGSTEYRIHGTNDPTTIGKNVSSGCIRLENSEVEDLYSRVNVGTKVIVLPNDPRASAQRISAIDSGATTDGNVAIAHDQAGRMTAQIAVAAR